MHAKCQIIVLIGGSGSNLQALIDNSALQQDAEIVGVISHRADAYGLQRAQRADIPTSIVAHNAYPSREEFETSLCQAIDAFEPALILLAGFMRILSADIVTRYEGKLLNIHPSLLPKYKGLHTHQRALEEGEKVHGASVHFVTAELDGGPIVAQIPVPVFAEDTEKTLGERVLHAEHWLYPHVALWFAQKRLQYQKNLATLDGKRLPSQGQQLSLPTITQGIVS